MFLVEDLEFEAYEQLLERQKTISSFHLKSFYQKQGWVLIFLIIYKG